MESNGLLETNENKPHAAMITSVDEDGSEDKENMNILGNRSFKKKKSFQKTTGIEWSSDIIKIPTSSYL